MQAVEWLLRSAARSGQSDDETGNRLRRREIQREPCAAEGRQRDHFVRSRTAAGAARASDQLGRIERELAAGGRTTRLDQRTSSLSMFPICGIDRRLLCGSRIVSCASMSQVAALPMHLKRPPTLDRAARHPS